MSFFVAILPILLLFVLMMGFKLSGHLSAFLTLVLTILLALFAAPDTSVATVGWSFVEGTLKAVFPILIIILMAIYSYNILVASGKIETVKAQFTSFTDDKGAQVLMLVWGFGGLLEGMAGFGTAVAIPAAILIGLGFKPMFSALVALIGNTVATGFGAVGVPVTTLCNETAPGGVATAEQLCEVSSFAVLQLSPLFVILPFIILMLTDRKAIGKNICLALWTGLISLGVQYACAHWLGAETPAIVGSIAAIAAIAVYARLFLPKPSGKEERKPIGAAETFKAWSVYLFILLFILLSGGLFPPVSHFLKTRLVSTVHLPVIGSVFKFAWLGNAGFMLFIGATLGGLVQGLSPRQLAVTLAKTIVNLRKTVITLISLIAMASIMNYSGMIAAIAGGLVAVTGSFYPFFAPLIGAIGTFVTGSDTSSNILFGKLQAGVAQGLGLEGSDANWLIASNTTGATGGKMISPQSIAIATAACEMDGKDGEILLSALPYAVLYILIGGLTVYFGL
ncbi:MAG: L-lactate permease [Bacteroidales bacterium]|nr:L-lactate permease [Bacteroidales bacterium]